MDDIEFQVRTFVAEFWRMKSIDECPLDARINHDLGIDGDDAVEFFEAFILKFGTDLTELNNDWRKYFKSEYFAVTSPLESVILGVAGLLTMALGLTIGLDGWPLFFFCVPFFIINIVASFYFFPLRKTKKRALTIAQMVEAARLGYWPKHKNGTSGVSA